MSKAFKVLVSQGSGPSAWVDVPATTPPGPATRIQAAVGARYQLVDPGTGRGPENVRVRRMGKDLGVSFEGREHADLTITGFYDGHGALVQALVGEAEDAGVYPYIPESAQVPAMLAHLSEGMSPVGMALGGEPLLPTGAAVGTLLTAALSPLWAAPAVLAGAAAAGGGASAAVSGGGSSSQGSGKTLPKVTSVGLASSDDTGASHTDGVTSSNLPKLAGRADPNVGVSLKVNGKTYTAQADAQGLFEVQVLDALPDGVQVAEVVVKDAAGNSSLPLKGTPFTVDTSASHNYEPQAVEDLNLNAGIQIVSISDDTGISGSDFITRDNTLVFQGLLNHFSANGDRVEVALHGPSGQLMARQWLQPEWRNNQWAWTWDLSTQSLADGTYELSCTVVDKAGNTVRSTQATQSVVVDTQVGPGRAGLSEVDDSGASHTDGLTAVNTPRLSGLVEPRLNVVVKIQGHEYTTQADGQGRFEVQLTQALPDGAQTWDVVVQDDAGNEAKWAGTPFTVDTSASHNYEPQAVEDLNLNAGIQIVSISDDTGISGSDFITRDNTLVFQGQVNAWSENGDRLRLVLLDAMGQVVGVPAYPKALAGQWSWSWDCTEHPLADGTYTLQAVVLDKADNTVVATEKSLQVDTQAYPDNDAQFPLVISRIDQDTGVSNADFLTHATRLSFTGNIGMTRSGFTGKVLVQLLGGNGQVMSMGYVDPDQTGAWHFDNTGQSLGQTGVNTQYLLKASLVDWAGNVFKSTDQSFTVDLKAPVFRIGGNYVTDSSVNLIQYTTMELKAGALNAPQAAEPGTYALFDGHGMPMSWPTRGVDADYEVGDFVIVYTDLAGNTTQSVNDKKWEFRLSEDISIGSSVPKIPPSTFGSGELAGPVGARILTAEEVVLDLANLHNTTPQVGDVAAINLVGLSGGGSIANADHTLKLSMGDVLTLGVKNSFVSTGAFKDHLQLRIDGDAGDKVLLDDLVGSSAAFHWSPASSLTLGGISYRVYSQADLGLDVLVQQAIQTTLV